MRKKEKRTITPELIRRYAVSLREQEKATATTQKYTHDLTALCEYLSEAALTKTILIGWKEHLTELYAPATVNTMLAAMNSLLDFCGWPDLKVKPLKIQKSMFCDEGKELTRSEYIRLIHAAEKEGNERLALVIQTICATGIRVSELKFVTAEAVQSGRAEISNKGKRRTVFLPDKLRRLLKKYLQTGKTKQKRALSLLLCAALLFSQMGVTTYAEGAETGGLCEHHPVHTAECGYTEPEPGTPCNHEHTEDCYRLVETCVHEHTAECYPEDEETDGTATPSNADKREPTECGHVCSEETGCVKKVLDCPHEHKVNGGEADREGGLGRDGDCGYIEAVEGHPCGYVCEICNAPDKDSGTPSDATKAVCVCVDRCSTETINEDCPICKDNPEQCVAPATDNGLTVKITGWEWIDPDGKLNEGALVLSSVSKENPVSFDGIVSMLPEQISATVNGGDKLEEITLDGWACKAFKQDENEDWPVQGEYTFAAALPEGYALAPDAKPLEIKVMLGGGNTLENSTGDFTVTGGTLDTDYSYAGNTLTIKSGKAITISGTTTTDKIVVENGVTANITLDGVDIDVSGVSGANALDITDATATLILMGENFLISGEGKAGVLVPANSALTIEGDGKLTVRGGKAGQGGGAGIGANPSGSCGTITINSGVVDTMAIGGGGAGIGLGGWSGTGGNHHHCGGLCPQRGRR